MNRQRPNAPQRPHPQKIYVKVTSDFDSTGYMQPKSITWADGRTFKIERVTDFRPASSLAASNTGEHYRAACYTVVIQGERKHLFFEKADALFHSVVGRWFVEVSNTA